MIVGYWISIILTTLLLSSVLISTILDFKYIDRFSRWWRGTHRLEDYFIWMMILDIFMKLKIEIFGKH